MEQFLNDFATDRNTQIFYAICLVILSEVSVGIFLLMRSKAFINNAISAMASIKEVQTYRTKNGTFDRLTVQFKDGMGNMYENSISYPSGGHNGKEIEILYDQNNPEKIISNNKLQVFLIPFAMIVGAFSFSGVLVIMTLNGIVTVPASFPF